MINFIWPPGTRLPAGTGGSENYTIGHIRELGRRGIPARVVTTGLGTRDGRRGFPDVEYLSLENVYQISNLDGQVVFINEAATVDTKENSFVFMHIPPPLRESDKAAMIKSLDSRKLIVSSKYAAEIWSSYTGRKIQNVGVAYPFAEPDFSNIKRQKKRGNKINILFAGRLSAEKGIYTLLEALHIDIIRNNPNYVFSVTTAGADKPEGRLIKKILNAHPLINLTESRKTSQAMAKLLSKQDIVVMPSNSQYWHETFGIVSIEAQKAGCRVVASNDGGLPETDCGGLILVEPDNADALAQGILAADQAGPLSDEIRKYAMDLFSVQHSVDSMLDVLRRNTSFVY